MLYRRPQRLYEIEFALHHAASPPGSRATLEALNPAPASGVVPLLRPPRPLSSAPLASLAPGSSTATGRSDPRGGSDSLDDRISRAIEAASGWVIERYMSSEG
jgi:hypothetical protein